MTAVRAHVAWSRHHLRTLAALSRVRTAVAGAGWCAAGGLLGDGGLTVRLSAAMASVALLIAFAQVVNDIVDVDVDRHHKPHRPIVAGHVSPRAAKAIAAGLLFTGLVAAALVGPGHLAAAVVIAVLAWAYSLRLKDTVLLGNAVVALLASAPVTYGAAAGAGVTALALALQAQVFVFMAAFEVVKTGIDAAGDEMEGLRTIATVHGVRATATLGAALGVVFTVAAAVAATIAGHPIWYVLIVGFGVVAPTLLASRALARAGSDPDDLRPAFGLLRAAWFAGVAAPFLL